MDGPAISTTLHPRYTVHIRNKRVFYEIGRLPKDGNLPSSHVPYDKGGNLPSYKVEPGTAISSPAPSRHAIPDTCISTIE